MGTGSMILAANVVMDKCNRDDMSTSLELYDSNLVDLTPGRRDLMNKYFPLNEKEPSPLLSEYFGVALAFAALGAMIRGLNSNKAKSDSAFSRKIQRMALQAILEGAMNRLHCLAQSALDSEKRLKENTAAAAEDRKAWESEMARLSLKVADAEAAVGEMRTRRGEDAKANEKVALIYSSHEQVWKTERKKLRHEIDLLRRDLLRKEVGDLYSPQNNVRKRSCEECEAKERHVSALQESLSEKEFFMMTAMEEAQSEEQERNALAAKLSIAESIAAELSEKLSTEVANAMRQTLILDEVKAKQQETERSLMKALEDLDNARKELANMALAVENQNSTTKQLLIDMAAVQKEVEDKEEVISAMLRRASREKEEKDDLAKKLAHSEIKRRHAENTMHRWKNVAEERGCPSHNAANSFHNSLGSRSELDELRYSQRECAGVELERMQSLTVRQVESLDADIALYRHKLCNMQEALSGNICADGDQMKLVGEGPKKKQSQEAVILQEPAEFIRSTWKAWDLQDPMKALAFKEWIELVKGRHAAQLEDKHWREIEAFERQMRAKDERIRAFRSQLLAMELESSKMKLEMEALRIKIKSTAGKEESCRLSSQKKLLGDVVQQCDCNENNIGDVKLQEMVELWKTDVMITNSNLGKALREKELDEDLASLQSITANAEIETEQNDMDLIMADGRLCQMQYEKRRKATKESSADNSHEEMKLHSETQDPTSEEAAMNSCLEVTAQTGELRTDNQTQTGLEVQSRKRSGELVEDASTVLKADGHKLQDLLLHEDNTNSMLVLNQTDASKEMIPFSELACLLPLDQETTHKLIQPLQNDSQMQGQGDLALSHSAHVKEQSGEPSSATPSELDTKEIKTISLHTKRKWNSNKQPLRSLSVSGSLTSKTEQTSLDNPSLQQAVHTEILKNSKFDIFQMLKKSTNFDKKQSQHVLSDIGETPQGPPSSKFAGSNVSRKDPQTIANIQVLSLALEVKRIEQQLADMNISGASCNAEVEIQPSDVQISHSTRFLTPNKLSKGYSALAGRVSQLVKQIGLTNTGSSLEETVSNHVKEAASTPTQVPVTSELSPQKNPICKKKSSPLALILLQRRAEAVRENLAAMQSKTGKKGGPRSAFDQVPGAPLSPSGQFVDTVQAHLSRVQDVLGLKLTHSSRNLEGISAAAKPSLQDFRSLVK